LATQISRIRQAACTETSPLLAPDRIIHHRTEMIALMCLCLRLLSLPLKSKIRLEAENAILRHQLIALERKIRGAFASPIAIAYFSFGSIVGFPQCWMRFGSSDPRPRRGGTRAGFRRYCLGNPERLIASMRRECTDHFFVLGEVRLRRFLKSYARYYNAAKTHRSLNKDSTISRPVHRTGRSISHPILGGLHQQYSRI
jgi:hypothetical protein